LFAEAPDYEHNRWLADKLALASTIKPGMTVVQLSQLFERENGVERMVTIEDWDKLKRSPDAHAGITQINKLTWCWCFHLKSCRLIKINVRFVGDANFQHDPKPESKITWVSRPFLDRHEVLD
jgi:hypothetical protein